MTLRETAAARANRPASPPPPPAAPAEHAEAQYEDDGREPDDVPVNIAWSRVMRDVRAIAKGGDGGRFESKYAGNYDFRGVDRCINAFGPVCRQHGVIVAPAKVQPTYRTEKTDKGKTATVCTLVVDWSVIGPRGDLLPTTIQSAGEAFDTSDKATTKAQSVALRILLLTLGLVPTDDVDPDAVRIELGEAPVRSPVSYRDEILNPDTTRDRMYQIRHEITQHRMAGAIVPDEAGKDIGLDELLVREGQSRWPRGSARPSPEAAPAGPGGHAFRPGPDPERCGVAGCGHGPYDDIHA